MRLFEQISFSFIVFNNSDIQKSPVLFMSKAFFKLKQKNRGSRRIITAVTENFHTRQMRGSLKEQFEIYLQKRNCSLLLMETERNLKF